MPLVIKALGGRHTATQAYTHILTREPKQFQETKKLVSNVADLDSLQKSMASITSQLCGDFHPAICLARQD